MADRFPDPKIEIRMTTLHSTRGPNYWSRLPITRMDVTIGAYENISSADVPWFTRSLVEAMPGLRDHRCSIGEPGGFLIRLKRGTYCAHIVEHVALELQGMIGHDVGYGRTRGGENTGEYTLIFEHRHEAVGLRAAALALEIVQSAFANTLVDVNAALTELRALAETSKTPPMIQNVLCGITGGSYRAETRAEMVRLGFDGNELIVDVSPAYMLEAGLPYSCSEIAIILDSELADVPERFRERRRADRLVSVLADAVREGGIAIVPAKSWDIQDLVRDAGCRVAIFATDSDVTSKDKKVARATAMVDGRRIILEELDRSIEIGWIHDRAPVPAQVAAALATFTLNELQPAEVSGAIRATGDRSATGVGDRVGVAD
ncbi:MAG: cyanophycin synthetase family protein [Gemmatimonadaceae bacterium]